MKSLITAISILAFLTATVTVNSIFVDRTVSELLDLCGDISYESPAESVRGITDKWQGMKKFLSLSVHETLIERADDAVLSLQSYLGTENDFNLHLSRFTTALSEISDKQKPSFKSIF